MLSLFLNYKTQVPFCLQPLIITYLFFFLLCSFWSPALGDRHLRHVPLPRHRPVSGLRAPGEGLPHGPAGGLPREGLRTHAGMWVFTYWSAWISSLLFLSFVQDFNWRGEKCCVLLRLAVEPCRASVFRRNPPGFWNDVSGIQHFRRWVRSLLFCTGENRLCNLPSPQSDFTQKVLKRYPLKHRCTGRLRMLWWCGP